MTSSGAASWLRRASYRRRRRRAAPRSPCSSGRRRGAAARPCRGACRGRAGGGARGLRASSGLPLVSFAIFPAYVLALVANSLALVGLRRAHLAHLGGDLADLLLVNALDEHRRRIGDLEGDPLRWLDYDRVREADVQLQVGAAQRRPVAHALQLEPFLEALRDALDHVRDQRAGQPVQCPVVAALGRTLDDEVAVVLLDLHPRGDVLAELAERPVHLHAPWGDRHVDPAGQFDWLFSDSTHEVLTR